jgi:CheY-like chemotaxis protein
MELKPDAQDSSTQMFDNELLAYLHLEGGLTEMLKAAIKMAHSGKKSEAKRIFLYVANSEPNNEAAWLWLASLSEYPEELLCFLKNALRVNPNNQKALEWQKNAHAVMARTFVQRGIVAYREEKKALAKQFFEEAVKNDSENEHAWLWLASVLENVEQKQACLEKVLRINPNNEAARSSLNTIKRQVAYNMLKKANAAFISGKTTEARMILNELMNFDSEIEEAWLLKAYLAESLDEKRVCFEKVLSLNPHNEMAKTGLEALRDIQKIEEKEEISSVVTSREHESAVSPEDAKVFEEGKVTVESRQLEEQAAGEEIVKSEALHQDLSEPVLQEIERAEVKEPIEVESGVGLVQEQFIFQQEQDFQQEQASYTVEGSLTQEESFTRQKEAVSEENLRAQEVSEVAEFETAREAEAGKTFLEEVETIHSETVEPELTEFKPEFDRPNDRTEDKDDFNFEVLESPRQDEIESVEAAETVAPEEIGAKSLTGSQQVLQEVESIGAKEQVIEHQEVKPEAVPQKPEEVSASQEKRRKVILIVDDSPTIRKLISVKLEKSGYDVMQATDGIEALAVIKRVVPDLILLDITMPNMDGYEVCKAIRSNDSTKDVPVIIISGKDGFFDKVRGQMAGSTGYITKPFGPETLMKTIEPYLKD